MNFTKWLDTFVDEKELNTDFVIEVQGDGDTNFIPLECLLDAIKSAPTHEQKAIKTTLIKIDFMNGDPMHFFKHLAQAIAI